MKRPKKPAMKAVLAWAIVDNLNQLSWMHHDGVLCPEIHKRKVKASERLWHKGEHVVKVTVRQASPRPRRPKRKP